uniref:Uncharacterized protein n=1 Tax=Rhizophora mucronata TaxID=61149 RepID=A0A2P2PBB9_RHIMU
MGSSLVLISILLPMTTSLSTSLTA